MRRAGRAPVIVFFHDGRVSFVRTTAPSPHFA
jgi:hypothetical protein